MPWTHDTLPLWQLTLFALAWSGSVRLLLGLVARRTGGRP